MTASQLARQNVMDRDQVWQVIDAQRLSLAGLLEQLSADEWRQRSLCAGWTVRDVAAHLTLQQLGLGGAIGMMARWSGSSRPDNPRRRPPARGAADRTDSSPGSGHGRFAAAQYRDKLRRVAHRHPRARQDIAIPLGRHHDVPPQAAAVAASRVLSMRWPPPLPASRQVAVSG